MLMDAKGWPKPTFLGSPEQWSCLGQPASPSHFGRPRVTSTSQGPVTQILEPRGSRGPLPMKSNLSHDLLVTVHAVISLGLDVATSPGQCQPPTLRNVCGTSHEEVAPGLALRKVLLDQGPWVSTRSKRTLGSSPSLCKSSVPGGGGCLPENARSELTKV